MAPLLRRDGAPEAQQVPKGQDDSLEISTRAAIEVRSPGKSGPRADNQPGSLGEAAAQGAADGARIGGLVANLGIGGMLIYKGLQGIAKVPTGSLFGRIIPYVGVAFSALGTLNSSRNLVGALSAPELDGRAVTVHSLDLASNLLIGTGTIALIAGAVAAPWLVAIGAGFLLGAASGLLHKN